MASTKKMLVAFDPARPDAQTSEFLIPWMRDGQMVFRGLKSGNEASLAMTVFVGRSVTEDDLFAKLIDSGAVIANVEETLALLRTYLDGFQKLKIGNVVRIRTAAPNDGTGVELELVAKTPSAAKA